MSTPAPPQPKPMRQLILGGLLPVLAFTAVEEYGGILWGIAAGMAFGLGELGFEWFTQKRVSALTLFTNGLILILGGVAFFTQEGLWFKLQPALIEGVMAVLLVGSVAVGKPLLTVIAEKQGVLRNARPDLLPVILKGFSSLSLRLGLFFVLHTALASWAALYWSTRSWALLKGVGFTVSFLIYLGLEVWYLRRRIAWAIGRAAAGPDTHSKKYPTEV